MEKIFASAFSLVIGLVGAWTGFRQLRTRAMLDGWQTTKGKVIERGTYRPSTANLSTPAFNHAPLVKYAYQVGGREFVNDRIRPQRIQLPEHNTEKWAREKAESFADEVTVHYNPADPGESFLVQTTKGTLYTLIGASCLVILFGLSFLLTK